MTTYFVSNAGSNTAPYDTEAKAATTLDTIEAVPWVAGDVVKISSTHTETAGAALTYIFPTTVGLQLLSVLFNGSGTGALTAGAAINVGAAAAAMSVGTGFAYGYGITFVAGTNNSASSDMLIGSGILPIGQVWESCTFSAPTASTTGQIQIGPSASASTDDIDIRFVNCTLSNGSDKAIILGQGTIKFDGLSLAGTAPTTVFTFTAGAPAQVTMAGSDISGLAWTNLANVAATTYARLKAYQCKLRASFTVTTGTIPGPGGPIVELIDCNSGDVNYYYTKVSWEGTVLADNTIYADASDGTNSISWLMTGNANSSFTWPLTSPPIATFNSTLSALTSTVEVTNDGTTFKDNELWQETMAKVTSGVPLGTWDRADRAADILAAGANQASSSVSWTGTGGFGAEVKQKLVSGSFTPAEIGPITVVVKLAKNDNVYVSPRVAIA